MTDVGQLFTWGKMTKRDVVTDEPRLKTGFDGARIENFALGTHHAIASTSKGKIYCWGSNELGQLGIDIIQSSDPPCLVALDDSAFVVDASEGGSACVTLKGSVLYWGIEYHISDSLVLFKLHLSSHLSKVLLGTHRKRVSNQPSCLFVMQSPRYLWETATFLLAASLLNCFLLAITHMASLGQHTPRLSSLVLANLTDCSSLAKLQTFPLPPLLPDLLLSGEQVQKQVCISISLIRLCCVFSSSQL